MPFISLSCFFDTTTRARPTCLKNVKAAVNRTWRAISFRMDAKDISGSILNHFHYCKVEFKTILYHHRSRLEFKTSSSCKNVCTRWYASVCYLAGKIYFVSFVYPVSGTVMTDQINKGTHLEWRVYCKNKCAFNTKSLKVR